MDRVITVFHEPIGQPRHRISTRGGFAKMYLPSRHEVHGFKRAIKAEWMQLKMLPSQRAVAVTIQAFFHRPKAKTWKRRPNPRYPHSSKPDIDNVAKAVMDALNKLAWIDDAQVARLEVSKTVCSGDDVPHVVITVRELSE